MIVAAGKRSKAMKGNSIIKLWLACWGIAVTHASILGSASTQSIIHFIHTSERKDDSNNAVPDMAQCAIESAVRQNPSHRILVHSRAWDLDALDHMRPSVTLVRLDLDSLFRKTEDGGELSAWYSSQIWNTGYKYHHLADAARLAILYKYGGTYMDLDIISTCPLDNAPAHFVGSEASNVLNNAVIQMSNAHHVFMRQAMHSFVRQFDALTFGWNGPQLLTRVWTQIGGGSFDADHGDLKVHLLPPVAFYDVPWDEAFKLFGPELSSQHARCCKGPILNQTSHSSGEPELDIGTGADIDKDENWKSRVSPPDMNRLTVTQGFETCSWGVHLWHSQIRAQLPFLHDLFPDSHLANVYRQNCPKTHVRLLSEARQSTAERGQVARAFIKNPVAGRQYRVGMLLPVEVQLVLAEPNGWFVASEHRVCVAVDGVVDSAQCSKLEEGSNALILTGIPTGHHLLRAVLCGKTRIGSDTVDDIDTDHDALMQRVCAMGGSLNGNNSGYDRVVGVGSVVSFNIDFQNAWKT